MDSDIDINSEYLLDLNEESDEEPKIVDTTNKPKKRDVSPNTRRKDYLGEIKKSFYSIDSLSHSPESEKKFSLPTNLKTNPNKTDNKNDNLFLKNKIWKSNAVR